MKAKIKITGMVYDPIKRRSYKCRITISGGIIEEIVPTERASRNIILPGFIDSHVHIESSMLTPQSFSRAAAVHGTVAVVADPHEIANVAGVKGIDVFINNAKNADIKIYFGAPSCVPASPVDDCFEILDAEKVNRLLEREDIHFLSEMMNYPGVITKNKDVLSKINKAKNLKKPIDGHAPLLSNGELEKYAAEGISTDHECSTLEEAHEKLRLGMKIQIREGSAAKNYNALHPLIKSHNKQCMFCTDDCHPDDLLNAHINKQVRFSLKNGYDIFDILQVASVNPVIHYGLKVGLLQEGDPADFIVVDSLETLRVKATYINGVNVLASKNKVLKTKHISKKYLFPNRIEKNKITIRSESKSVKVMRAIDGELITEKEKYKPNVIEGVVNPNISEDILKIVIVNRYNQNEVFASLIKGFGLKKGSIASSIAHDSHHILSVGCDDESIFNALKYVIEHRGGISYSVSSETYGLPLPVFGLLSNENVAIVSKKYKSLVHRVKENGCSLKSPFMTLAFMSLTVIPRLKISPRGLFDVESFSLTPFSL